jgi:nucleoid DNA-binding protein
MKKPEIARRMARRTRLSEADAADRLDHLVTELLSRLRQDREAPLPGLGKFRYTPDGQLVFELEAKSC